MYRSGLENIVPSAEAFLINNAEDHNTFKTTEMYEVSRFFCGQPFTPIFDEIESKFWDKKILLLIPGFTSTEEQVQEAVLSTAEKVQKSYDVVIGYIYPSGKAPNYIAARKLANCAAQSLVSILDDISFCAGELDVAAHSMGAYVIFNTLQHRLVRQPLIDNLFLLGGADRQESLYNCFGPGCTRYPFALNNVNVIFNLLTCSDQTLPLHTLLVGQNTLGNPVKWDVDLLAVKVKIIDTTEVANGHSGFLVSPEIFAFINYVARGGVLSKRSYRLVNNMIISTDSPAVCVPKVAQVIRVLAEPIITVVGAINTGLNFWAHSFKKAFS